MSAYEAALEAVAVGMAGDDVPPHNEAAAAFYRAKAERGLAALTTSVAVREALVELLAGHACPKSEPCIDGDVASRKIGLILAALRPPEAPRA